MRRSPPPARFTAKMLRGASRRSLPELTATGEGLCAARARCLRREGGHRRRGRPGRNDAACGDRTAGASRQRCRVPVLFQAATAGSAARRRPPSPHSPESPAPAPALIAKLADQGDAKSRAVAINTLAQRNDPAASAGAAQIRRRNRPRGQRAACAALAKWGPTTSSRADPTRAGGKNSWRAAALQAVASRATDKSAAAQKFIALTQTAPPQQLGSLFESCCAGRERGPDHAFQLRRQQQ